MKRVVVLVLGAILVAGVSVALAGEKAAKPVEGTLVDSKCFLAGGDKGNDHMGMKNCGSECAKSGSPLGVLTSAGKYYTLAAPSPQLADYVGQTVRATGTIKSGTILADKVEVKKGDKWEEVKFDSAM
ncbi:MAG: hypothetical protein ACRD35_07065 [Candidatus Acidiferrales bacterium]